MNAAADPRIQNAAFNAAKDSSFQKAAFGAASSFASGQPPAKVASSLASNPAFQKAAANAAKDPGVRAAAWDTAKDPSLQKAALSGVSSSLGYRPQPHPPAQTRKTTVLAIADFDAVEGDDLPIREGDVITVLEEIDENWYRGTSSRGTGMFPKNHVQPN
ncbi:SH3 domain-containing protein [Obelidium mucronatum]|nr:SH3 domain-containing protein [Obelidium mucronatum]